MHVYAHLRERVFVRVVSGDGGLWWGGTLWPMWPILERALFVIGVLAGGGGAGICTARGATGDAVGVVTGATVGCRIKIGVEIQDGA